MTQKKSKKDKMQQRIVDVIWGIYRRMTDRAKQKTLLRCVEFLPRWKEGDHLMPGAFPHKDQFPTKVGSPDNPRFKRAIVTYEVKLTVARFWTLKRMDETVGLSQLLHRLERYAAWGWDNMTVAGDESVGFWLVLPGDEG